MTERKSTESTRRPQSDAGATRLTPEEARQATIIFRSRRDRAVYIGAIVVSLILAGVILWIFV